MQKYGDNIKENEKKQTQSPSTIIYQLFCTDTIYVCHDRIGLVAFRGFVIKHLSTNVSCSFRGLYF